MEWMEVTLRSLIALTVLFIMTKLLGKRQITQLSLFEYIVGITIGNLAAHTSLEIKEKWYLGILSLLIWGGISFIMEAWTLKSKKLRDVVDGKGTILIKEGNVLEENLKKEHLTVDELLEQLRKKNVFRVADVEFAMMETNGEVSVMLKKEHQPITLHHLGINTTSEKPPHTVIMDGNIMDEELAACSLNRHWLKNELQKNGVTIENVVLGQVDSNGQLYIDLYDDQRKVLDLQMKPGLLADLQKCKERLQKFADSSKSPKEKKTYANGVKTLQTTIEQVKDLL